MERQKLTAYPNQAGDIIARGQFSLSARSATQAGLYVLEDGLGRWPGSGSWR